MSSAPGRVLVTGGTGFVGKALLESKPDLEWIALTRSGTPDWAESMENVEWVPADLASPGFAASLPGGIGSVMHLARSRRHREFPDGADDVFAVDLASTAALLDHARNSGVSRFVLASTATVYAPSDGPLNEGSTLEPGRHFAACKRASELLIESYAGVMETAAIRLFTLYGPGQSGQLIGELIERVRAGEPIEVQGDRGLLMSPIHVEDAAAALGRALDAELSADTATVVNAGGARSMGIREVGEEIGRALGTEPAFKVVEGAEPGGFTADNSRAGQLLGWHPEIGFAEGLRGTIDPAGSL